MNTTIKGIAKAVETSANEKLGGMSTTYSSIKSCPNACPFKSSGGCYGMAGPVSWMWNKLNKRKASTMEIARAEARAIDSLSGKHDLRLHTLGDCSTNEAARVVSAAVERFMDKGGKAGFTYTHAWRKVKRASWGCVSVMASCETEAEVRQARALGYATAIVVPEHKTDKAYKSNGLHMIPCPEQTGRADNCAKCRLCLNDKKLKAAGATIVFAVHGNMAKKTKAALAEKQPEPLSSEAREYAASLATD